MRRSAIPRPWKGDSHHLEPGALLMAPFPCALPPLELAKDGQLEASFRQPVSEAGKCLFLRFHDRTEVADEAFSKTDIPEQRRPPPNESEGVARAERYQNPGQPDKNQALT